MNSVVLYSFETNHNGRTFRGGAITVTQQSPHRPGAGVRLHSDGNSEPRIQLHLVKLPQNYTRVTTEHCIARPVIVHIGGCGFPLSQATLKVVINGDTIYVVRTVTLAIKGLIIFVEGDTRSVT